MVSKQFVTAAKAADRDDTVPEPLEFTLDEGTEHERDLTVYYPGDGALALLIAETSRHQTTQTKVAAAIDYFYEMFTDEDASYIRRRLLDKEDDFGLSEVQDVIEWVVEEWSGGRPTKRSSGSTRSRNSTGSNSRRRTPASA